jgi:hypothetical protein
MRDLVDGRYHVPWEDQIVHVDGTSCGFPPPERVYGGSATTTPGGPGADGAAAGQVMLPLPPVNVMSKVTGN